MREKKGLNYRDSERDEEKEKWKKEIIPKMTEK